jgi:rSAM/selenodomain-associated transferase 1
VYEPTLIIFAREPVSGVAKTRLIPALGPRKAAALAHAFNLDAVAKAAALGVPVLVAGAGRRAYFTDLAGRAGGQFIAQGRGNLGKKMARTLNTCHLNGAILIGTDTPTLPSRCLSRAIDLLRKFPVVLGPSLDGGYYLVGVRGPMPEIFSGIEWGTETVLSLTLQRLTTQAIRYALAPIWYDVDDANDLPLLAAHLRLLRSDHAKGDDERRKFRGAQQHPCPATAALLEKFRLI